MPAVERLIFYSVFVVVGAVKYENPGPGLVKLFVRI